MKIANEMHWLAQKQYIPVKVMIEITSKCNLDCSHCYAARKKHEIIPIELWVSLLEQLADAGCLFLTITGGEPFTRQDIFEILQYARRRSFSIEIKTNGTLLTPEYIKRLHEINPLNVDISIYSAEAQIHDQITHVKGSFGRSMAAIKMLLAQGVRVGIKTPLIREAFEDYENIKDLALDLGIEYGFDPVITARNDGRIDNLHNRISEAQLKEFIFVEHGEYLQTHTLQQHEYDPEEHIGCRAGKTMGFISSEGNVHPCVQNPIIAGNIKNDTFYKIWHDSESMKKIRQMKLADLKDCKFCKIRGYCNRCPGLALLENGSLTGISPENCRQAKVFADVAQDIMKSGAA